MTTQPAVRKQCIAFLLAALLLTFRTLLFRDIREPWAEDGTDIIPAALSTSWSLLQPVVDVLLLTARLFGLAATAISVEWSPALISIFSIILYSFIASYFCRPGFSWLVSSERVRLLASISFAIAPGTMETVGNASCTIYTMPVWGILLLLERPHAKWIVPKWIFILFSTPLVFISTPLLVFQYLVRRERLYLFLLGLNGMGVLSSLVLREFSPHPVIQTELSLDWRLLEVFHVFWGGMLAPVLGVPGVFEIANFPSVVILLILSLCVALVGALRRVPQDVAAATVGILAIVPLYHVVHALSRSYGYDFLELSRALMPHSRFAFFTILFPMMGWFVVVSHASDLFPGKHCSVILAAVMLINLVTFLALARDMRVEQRSAWPDFQAWLSRAGSGDVEVGSTAQLTIMIPPFEWAILKCTREKSSTVCQVAQGNLGNEVYILPVNAGADPR